MDAALIEPEQRSPDDPTQRSWKRGALAGAAAACGCIAIAAVNPTDTGVPICWSQGVFGIDCPLCGGLRSVNALMRGDVLAAADHNVLTTIALPIIAVVWAVWMLRTIRRQPFRWPTPPVWLLTSLAVVAVTFTIVRNMDLGPVANWLAATAQ